MQLTNEPPHMLPLHDLNEQVVDCLHENFPEPIWVLAEISSLQVNRNGHCYLELIEKEEDGSQLLAKAKATIWRNVYAHLSAYFQEVTGQPLQVGLRVALCVEVSFHELYGYSLQVQDIYPEFTLGDQMRQRQQIVQRLHEEGVFDMNRELPMPVLPLRVAVISAPGAAGWGDFSKELEHHEQGFHFQIKLFPAVMQGDAAEKTIVAAFDQIAEEMDNFDVVVLIRGGGAVSDLSCFDSYFIAYHITQFPLPVIVGVGHDRDVSVADMVACVSVKTPTAVAQYLIRRVNEAYEGLQDIQQRFYNGVVELFQRQTKRIEHVEALLPLCAQRLLERKNHQLDLLEKTLQLLSPDNLLKKGYTLTLCNGKMATAQNLKTGDVIETVFYDGSKKSTIQ